jgi:hypothetical protein
MNFLWSRESFPQNSANQFVKAMPYFGAANAIAIVVVATGIREASTLISTEGF